MNTCLLFFLLRLVANNLLCVFVKYMNLGHIQGNLYNAAYSCGSTRIYSCDELGIINVKVQVNLST